MTDEGLTALSMSPVRFGEVGDRREAEAHVVQTSSFGPRNLTLKELYHLLSHSRGVINEVFLKPSCVPITLSSLRLFFAHQGE